MEFWVKVMAVALAVIAVVDVAIGIFDRPKKEHKK